VDDWDIESLLTRAELTTFQASLPGAVERLSDRQLGLAIDRCRLARDKYRDLYDRQSGSGSAKRRSRGEALAANARSGRTVEILGEALDRLERERAARAVSGRR
jgi:hypothetical protein